MSIKQVRQMRDQAKTQQPAAASTIATHSKEFRKRYRYKGKGLRGPHYVHALRKELPGLLSVDVYPLKPSDDL